MQTYPYIYHPPTGNLCNRNTPVCHRLLCKRGRRKRRCTHLQNSLWSCTLVAAPPIDDFCITICLLCSPYRILGHIRNRLPSIRGLVSMILRKYQLQTFNKNFGKRINLIQEKRRVYLLTIKKNIFFLSSPNGLIFI